MGVPEDAPPGAWLVSAAERHEGRLCGLVAPSSGWLRVDAICVPARGVPGLLADLAALDADRDRGPHQSPVGELALAEGWDDGQSTSSRWEGGLYEVRARVAYGSVLSPWWD